MNAAAAAREAYGAKSFPAALFMMSTPSNNGPLGMANLQASQRQGLILRHTS